MYNLTSLVAGNNLYDIGLEMNNLSGGLFFALSMLILFIVYLAVFKKQNFKDVFFAGTFVMTIISILLFVAGFVDYRFILIPLIAFFASVIIFYFVQRD
jgi:glucan phosphoethanolaminetransferase (alkaline phosphatase superfamily)